MEKNMIKRLLLSTLLLLSSLPVFAADEAAAQNFEAGTHYDLINPAVRTENQDKVEVLEFFWYGCGHCYTFEPMIGQWKKTLAEDVDFSPTPAMWNPAMELHARAFYAAEVLGVGETMHPALFQAMNVDNKRLKSEAEISELFQANGVAAEDFDKAFNSFGVSSQVRQANSKARAAKVNGTPSMMINGKYFISTRKAGSQSNMLKLADYLIEQERATKGS
jgi:thiol:disulfide interchange protein DsbA